VHYQALLIAIAVMMAVSCAYWLGGRSQYGADGAAPDPAAGQEELVPSEASA
jgi:hypothetical protein